MTTTAIVRGVLTARSTPKIGGLTFGWSVHALTWVRGCVGLNGWTSATLQAVVVATVMVAARAPFLLTTMSVFCRRRRWGRVCVCVDGCVYVREREAVSVRVCACVRGTKVDAAKQNHTTTMQATDVPVHCTRVAARC